jgi:ABC-type phosphate transport system substrate-binding protein
MSLFHTALKAGASLTLLALVSIPASAAPLPGGGSSLLAPYIAQVYCARVGGFSSTGPCSPTAASTDKVKLYNSSAQQDIVSTSSVASTPDTTDTFNYLISNSAGGQKAILANTPSLLGTFPSGVSFSAVVFGYSDAALSSAALNAYTNGGDIGDLSISLKAPDGSTIGTPAYTLYNNPQASGSGPLIQIPVTIDPVAVGYNPASLSGLSGTLKLSKTTYCGIFNHTITDWNDAAITADNGGSVTGGSSLAIVLVGRTNGSGTTSIFTKHLEAVCSGVTGNQFTSANLSAGAYKNIPSTLQTYYSLQSDSAHEVTAINGNTGAIGYVGADYATPSTAVSTTVKSALLKADDGSYNLPSAANALTAFGTIAPPSGSARLDPANWVPATAANPSAGYNIIGTTNVILSSLQGSTGAAKVSALVASSGTEGFLRWYYRNGDSAPSTIMGAANLGVLPSNWTTAITESFIDGSDGLGLCIRTTASATCGN